MEFNYCPKCGEELVEDASFCHSCGQGIKDPGNATQSDKEDSSVVSDISTDVNVTMEDIDLTRPSSGDYGELEERVENVVEEQGYTINDVSGEQVLKALIIDKIIERSARIKVDKQSN